MLLSKLMMPTRSNLSKFAFMRCRDFLFGGAVVQKTLLIRNAAYYHHRSLVVNCFYVGSRGCESSSSPANKIFDPAEEPTFYGYDDDDDVDDFDYDDDEDDFLESEFGSRSRRQKDELVEEDTIPLTPEEMAENAAKAEQLSKKLWLVGDNWLLVSKLPWTMHVGPLREHFVQFGEVEETGVAYSKETSCSCEYGFVKFKDEEAMRKALAHGNGSHVIEGDPIKVELRPPRDQVMAMTGDDQIDYWMPPVDYDAEQQQLMQSFYGDDVIDTEGVGDDYYEDEQYELFVDDDFEGEKLRKELDEFDFGELEEEVGDKVGHKGKERENYNNGDRMIDLVDSNNDDKMSSLSSSTQHKRM